MGVPVTAHLVAASSEQIADEVDVLFRIIWAASLQLACSPVDRADVLRTFIDDDSKPLLAEQRA